MCIAYSHPLASRCILCRSIFGLRSLNLYFYQRNEEALRLIMSFLLFFAQSFRERLLISRLTDVLGCTMADQTSPCTISVTVNPLISANDSYYDAYNLWGTGYTRLNWYGAQPGQGIYNGMRASGSPTAPTTNISGSPGYQSDNV